MVASSFLRSKGQCHGDLKVFDKIAVNLCISKHSLQYEKMKNNYKLKHFLKDRGKNLKTATSLPNFVHDANQFNQACPYHKTNGIEK